MNRSANDLKQNFLNENQRPSSVKVLFVADNRELSETIKSKVQVYPNLKCHFIADPYEALQDLCDVDYDLIFIDQTSEQLNSVNILKKADLMAKSDPLIIDSARFKKAVPVVIMSEKKQAKFQKRKFTNFKLLDIIDTKDIFKCLAYNLAPQF